MEWNSPRKIIHIDMDAFYAAVEQRDNPELRGKPVIIGGDPNSRSVVSTASYEARTFGVHSAMPTSQAKRLCPKGIFLHPNFRKYAAVSRQIFTIMRHYTARVQSVSLDEAYLDVTRNTLQIQDPVQAAQMIQQNIRGITQLTCSAGVASNKLLAKIASDINKPNGICVVYPDQAESFLETLSVRKIPGVGPVTEKELNAAGIKTCRDLATWSLNALTKTFGNFGDSLYKRARGIDESEVINERTPKQVGCEETFSHDLIQLNDCEKALRELSQELERRITKAKLWGRTVVLKVKYDNFEQITRNAKLSTPTRSAELTARKAIELLHSKTEAGHRKVRLLGISLANLTLESAEQNNTAPTLPGLFEK